MGCAYSGHRRRNSGGVRSFRVHNVDDQGMELNRGNIEIRENDLVLFQKGKEPIRWPLRCLRRYGFDAELFSFESGRRCAMGPGIYAFKCSHAEELFNLVQESIQRAGEEDQRGQQLSHSHPSPTSGVSLTSRNHGEPGERQFSGNLDSVDIRRAAPLVTDTPAREHEAYGIVLSDSLEDTRDGANGRTDSSHLYVNGVLVSDSGHDYVNAGSTRANSGAFLIDDTAALVDFLHNPPGVVTSRSGVSQVNYAELCMPDCHLSQASMENLLDETGQGALHNVERRGPDLRNRLSQHSLSFGGLDTRISVPNDLLAEASQDSDSILHSTDSDVFLADIPPEGLVCPNYVNLALEEARAAAAPPPLACQEIVLPPSHETVTNYANLTLHGPRIPKAFKQVNYIVIDHNNQSNEAVSSSVGGNAGNNSPTSPTSCMSIPESPSRKTESYAMIDFDRTVALSNATRLTEDGGTRKTRHNSTISDMP